MTDWQNLPDLAGLNRHEWLDRLEDYVEDHGQFEPLGPAHSAAFLEAGAVCLVSFEPEATAMARERGLPLGMVLSAERGWSSLTLLADGETWFRHRAVWGHFDRLIDEGFFDRFDRVIFLGEGICGYAACAFSVAAPGATVLAVQPQATQDPLRAGWDRRFPWARRLDFTSRYGFAPQMAEAADKVFLFFDPDVTADAIHAAFFTCDNTVPLRVRHLGANLLPDLGRMGALGMLLDAAGGDAGLTAATARSAMRLRRSYPPWQRGLITTLQSAGRPQRLAKARRALAGEPGRRHPRQPQAGAGREPVENGPGVPPHGAASSPETTR